MANVKAEVKAKYWEAKQALCWCPVYGKKIGSQDSQYRQDIQCQEFREETSAGLKSVLGTNFLLKALLALWQCKLDTESDYGDKQSFCSR